MKGELSSLLSWERVCNYWYRVGVSESVVWGFSFELTNNYRVWNMGCERSLAFFLSEKIILYPTTYFKPSLDGVWAYFRKPQRRQRSVKASLSSHVSNWMPSSEAATLSDLSALICIEMCDTKEAVFAGLSPEGAFPQVPRLISACRRSSLLPCDLLKIHLCYPGAFKSRCSVAIFDLFNSVRRFPGN